MVHCLVWCAVVCCGALCGVDKTRSFNCETWRCVQLPVTPVTSSLRCSFRALSIANSQYSAKNTHCCSSDAYAVLQLMLYCNLCCTATYAVLQLMLYCNLCCIAAYAVLQLMLYCILCCIATLSRYLMFFALCIVIQWHKTKQRNSQFSKLTFNSCCLLYLFLTLWVNPQEDCCIYVYSTVWLTCCSYNKRFPCNKTNQMHKSFKFILEMKLYMFRTVSLSIISSYSLYTQQWYMSYRFVDSFRAAAAGSGWNCNSNLIPS
jgi:hypothetical protein